MAQTIGQMLSQMCGHIALPIGDHTTYDRHSDEQRPGHVQETHLALRQTVIEHLFEDPGYGQTEPDDCTGTDDGHQDQHRRGSVQAT